MGNEVKNLKAFEAAGFASSRLRRPATLANIDGLSVDAVNAKAGMTLVKQARFLEQNYDIATALLDDLVSKVIGTGIKTKPLILNKAGKPLAKLNKQIAKLHKLWCEKPDITGGLSEAEAQQLEFRTFLRDGEIFIQKITGGSAPHNTRVPFSIEHIECDFLPTNLTDANPTRNIVQGIEKDSWGRAVAYWFYHNHPGALSAATPNLVLSGDYRRVSADRICHLKRVQRPKQTRGVTVFASVINRLMDLRDWDASALTAARVNATMIFQILRDISMQVGGKAYNADDDERDFEVASGMVWDELYPGERVEMLKSEHPNPNGPEFRDDQIRCFASGTGGSYSSIAKKYDGSYSSRRQERLEHDAHIKTLRGTYIAQRVQPVYEAFVNALLLNGLIQLPSNVDMDSLYSADHRGPTLKSIDPEKEARANLSDMQSGLLSREEAILSDGRDPDAVFERIREERERDAQNNVTFSSNTGKSE